VKHEGLGETSKDLWSVDDEEDPSRKQILMEKKQAQRESFNHYRNAKQEVVEQTYGMSSGMSSINANQDRHPTLQPSLRGSSLSKGRVSEKKMQIGIRQKRPQP